MTRSRRTWLFVPGADEAAHEAAALCGADVLIQELEDFTPADLRPPSHAHWRTSSTIVGGRPAQLPLCG